MDQTAAAFTAAMAFSWLGMVVAISFLEAPLKFRAPGVTIPIGLGIGRIVFRALNIVEIVFALCVVLAIVLGNASAGVLSFGAAAVLVLAVQLVGIRPRLNRRTDRVLAGESLPRSRLHFAYIGAEIIKILLLLPLGVLAL